MSRHCFTYGTLMCQSIMFDICGARFDSEPASLLRFSRHPVIGEPYPGIRRREDAFVDGRLYRNVDDASFKRLDDFEGEQYYRATVEVVLSDGSPVKAQTYIFQEALIHMLRSDPWDFDTFLRKGRLLFKARYPGFNRS